MNKSKLKNNIIKIFIVILVIVLIFLSIDNFQLRKMNDVSDEKVRIFDVELSSLLDTSNDSKLNKLEDYILKKIINKYTIKHKVEYKPTKNVVDDFFQDKDLRAMDIKLNSKLENSHNENNHVKLEDYIQNEVMSGYAIKYEDKIFSFKIRFESSTMNVKYIDEKGDFFEGTAIELGQFIGKHGILSADEIFVRIFCVFLRELADNCEGYDKVDTSTDLINGKIEFLNHEDNNAIIKEFSLKVNKDGILEIEEIRDISFIFKYYKT